MINYLPPKEESFSDFLHRLYPENTKQVYEITLQLTENCCMACTYCYQHHKTEKHMTFEIAKMIIDKVLNNEIEQITTLNTFGLIINFIGGEPFLEIDLIDQICNYVLTEMSRMKHPWLNFLRFSICSNGLLYLTPQVQSLFKKYGSFISFAISIDGNKELHDKCRLDLQGNGTYDKVVEAISHHKKQFKSLPSTKMTLSPDNIDYTFVALENLIKLGYISIPCNCVFEQGWNLSHAKIFYYELKKVADYLIDNNLYNKINISLFDEKYFSPLDENNNTNWCGGVDMKSMSFDYKGDIFPCIRYMESSLNNKQPAIKVGNILTGYAQSKEEKSNLDLITNITRRSQSTDECFYCPIANGCAWCSGYNYEEFGTPNKRATYICEMHRARSLANVYYWNKLYKKLNIDKHFNLYLDKQTAIKIIDLQEYNYLLSL